MHADIDHMPMHYPPVTVTLTPFQRSSVRSALLPELRHGCTRGRKGGSDSEYVRGDGGVPEGAMGRVSEARDP